MTQFPRRSAAPMTPRSYWRIAQTLRDIAHELDAASAAETPLQKRVLKMRLKGLAGMSRAWLRRHLAHNGEQS